VAAPGGRRRVSRLAAIAVRSAERAIPLLPAAADAVIATVAGTLAYRLSPGARAAVRANLGVIAPERRDRERLVRATFIAQVRHYLEIFRLARLDPGKVLREIRVIGWDEFVATHARGRGVIIASAHLGPVSVCGQVLVLNGYPATLPIERETSELASAINRARTAMGLRFVQTDSALGIRRVLRQGGVLGILADRAVTGVGERVPFFGREALLPSAHVALALRTGAPVIPAFARREGGTICAIFEPELHLRRTDDHAADIRDGVRRFAAILERQIRAVPDQWSVFEPVWDR